MLDRAELIEKFSLSFTNKIFQPDILFEGLNSDLVELPDGRVSSGTGHRSFAVGDTRIRRCT